MRQRLGLSRELWIQIFGKSWSRALERKGPVLICMHRWERPRRRRRRLHMSREDPKRPREDLRTTNRQDSTDAPAMAASLISRIKKINFFGPQEVAHCSLWTISEPNDTQTAACAFRVCLLVSYRPLAALKTGAAGRAVLKLAVVSALVR